MRPPARKVAHYLCSLLAQNTSRQAREDECASAEGVSREAAQGRSERRRVRWGRAIRQETNRRDRGRSVSRGGEQRAKASVENRGFSKINYSVRLRRGSLLHAIALFCFVFTPVFLFAQTADTLPIAKTITVSDPEVAYGDIILYDPDTNLYRISQGVNDPRVFGIVVENPTLLLETDAALVPVAESGRLFVNVTLEGGDIAVGDPIITSSVFGKGMRADSRYLNIIGFALEPLTSEDGVVIELEGGREVVSGTILVEVRGKRALLAADQNIDPIVTPPDDVHNQTVVRFSFAALVALGSLALTFLTFLLSIRQGVISVGRNPLAKASIRSMVILNIILALIVSTVGIFFAVSILIAPL